MRWPWQRLAERLPASEIDRLLDENIAALEAAVRELKSTAAQLRGERR